MCIEGPDKVDLEQTLLVLRNRHTRNVGELGEVFLHVSIALRLDTTLARPATTRSAFAIAFVNLVHVGHTFDYFSEWCEAHPIKTRVVTKIDKHLCRAGIWTSRCKADRSRFVRCFPFRVILELRVFPNRRNSRITMNAELSHEPFDRTEDRDILKEAHLNQVIKAVSAKW